MHPVPDTPIQTRLLRWFAEAKRAMPWRLTRDPYAIWVSEAMLQQTQVATVIPYYERFMSRFPDVGALAQAPLDEVLALWAGLGYYSRARNLHAAALAIVRDHAGVFPADRAALRALPGVGPYTAGAILSIAFGLPVPAIDGNVERVLCRLLRIPGAPRKPPARGRIEAHARELVDCSDPGSMTQALMELGATVCTPANPACDRCPLQVDCLARAAGEQASFPQLPPRPAREQQTTAAAVIESGELVLLAQREETGVWAGLWEFPQTEILSEPDEALSRHVHETLGLRVRVCPPLMRLTHGIMNRHITLSAYRCEIIDGELTLRGYRDARWVDVGQTEEMALSSPHRRVARKLAEG